MNHSTMTSSNADTQSLPRYSGGTMVWAFFGAEAASQRGAVRKPLRASQRQTRSDEGGRIDRGCNQSRRAGVEVGVKPKHLSNPPPQATTSPLPRRRPSGSKTGKPAGPERKAISRMRARARVRHEHGNRKKSSMNSASLGGFKKSVGQSAFTAEGKPEPIAVRNEASN
jgi:hypothetical protein